MKKFRPSIYLLVIFIYAVSCRETVKDANPANPANTARSNNIELNGQNFFPIAIYTWCPDILIDTGRNELNILKEAGFNLIDVKLKDTLKDKYRDFFDNCKLRDINIIIEGNTDEATRGYNDPLFFKSMISNYGYHPSVFGFSISDDANNGKYPISNLKSLDSNIKKWDNEI